MNKRILSSSFFTIFVFNYYCNMSFGQIMEVNLFKLAESTLSAFLLFNTDNNSLTKYFELYLELHKINKCERKIFSNYYSRANCFRFQFHFGATVCVRMCVMHSAARIVHLAPDRFSEFKVG